MQNNELQRQQDPTSAQMGASQISRERELEENGEIGAFFWSGTPSDYPETNTYEYERVCYIDSAGV